ncbi:helix-turn-helix domain-containing protein [Mesonia ostreae]|uniref:AraC family transcriptional regulator n=1 Tax=Mesonia ostreae TaxID=861110 RepID=A0ABU2KES3_9FLAO|nr:AraC family transcriptional regulator [Mesonia ostreae]MDT0293168.1 AraC family transcriptional regulator [Mesonia ostreae]
MIKTIYLKNMVCERCIKVLKNEIEAQQIELQEIELGRLQLNFKNDKEIEQVEAIIKNNGFERINSTEEKVTEQVKLQLIQMLHRLPLQIEEKLSTYLAKHINQDYSKISKIFSHTEEITIEKYFIKLKIEKVKELIQANEKNFTEISQLLDYSHINHLSRQFKAETGLSLSQYKSQHQNFRNPLDQIV